MGLLRFLPFALLAVPLAEIGVFILVGSAIGVFATIGLVIATAVLGATLLRHQGVAQLMKIQSEMASGRMPGRDVADGAMILVAGVLLLTPGFITDTLGFLLFVPAVRATIFSWLAARVTIVSSGISPGFDHGPRPGHARGEPGVIDLGADDYARDDDQDGAMRR